MGTHPGTNRARRALTLFIRRTPLTTNYAKRAFRCTAPAVCNSLPSTVLEYKQFSCGLCDKQFTRNVTVKKHFKKCCVERGLTGVLLQ